MTAKFSFLMAAIGELLAFRDKFLKIGIVQLECDRFDIVVDIAPENVLNAVQCMRKQIQLQPIIQIFRNHLGIVVDFEDNVPAIAQDRQLVITFLGQLPDGSTIAGFKVHQLVTHARVFQNSPLHEAVGAPRKLKQLDHYVGRKCWLPARSPQVILRAAGASEVKSWRRSAPMLSFKSEKATPLGVASFNFRF